MTHRDIASAFKATAALLLLDKDIDEFVKTRGRENDRMTKWKLCSYTGEQADKARTYVLKWDEYVNTLIGEIAKVMSWSQGILTFLKKRASGIYSRCTIETIVNLPEKYSDLQGNFLLMRLITLIPGFGLILREFTKDMHPLLLTVILAIWHFLVPGDVVITSWGKLNAGASTAAKYLYSRYYTRHSDDYHVRFERFLEYLGVNVSDALPTPTFFMGTADFPLTAAYVAHARGS